MKLICLGTNGFHPTDESHTSCYIIPSLGIIFDAGTAFFRVLNLIQTPIIHIFLSHGHLDHISGITDILSFSFQPNKPEIRIYGEKHVLDAVDKLFEPPYFPIKPLFQLIPLTSDPLILSNGSIVTNFSLKHRGSCLGFKIVYENKSISYITDTTSDINSTYIKDVQNVDLLLHELYFNNNNFEISKSSGHTYTNGLKEFCNKTNPKKIVLIHHDPSGNHEELFNESLNEISKDLIWSKDKMEIEF